MVTFKKKIAGLSAESLERFALRARKSARLKGKIDILITTNSDIRLLNARFRGKNKPTDVLSFPAAAQSNGVNPAFIGEVAISADIALDNARRLGHSGADEVKILVLHGILHLAGFDHERDNGQMARKEASLRRVLRLPSSLTERGEFGVQPSTKSRRLHGTSAKSQRTA